MEVLLPQHQLDQLAELAARTSRSPAELICEAVGQMLECEEHFAHQIQQGIDQFERGEFVDEEAMDRRVDELLRA